MCLTISSSHQSLYLFSLVCLSFYLSLSLFVSLSLLSVYLCGCGPTPFKNTVFFLLSSKKRNGTKTQEDQKLIPDSRYYISLCMQIGSKERPSITTKNKSSHLKTGWAFSCIRDRFISYIENVEPSDTIHLGFLVGKRSQRPLECIIPQEAYVTNLLHYWSWMSENRGEDGRAPSLHQTSNSEGSYCYGACVRGSGLKGTGKNKTTHSQKRERQRFVYTCLA